MYDGDGRMPYVMLDPSIYTIRGGCPHSVFVYWRSQLRGSVDNIQVMAQRGALQTDLSFLVFLTVSFPFALSLLHTTTLTFSQPGAEHCLLLSGQRKKRTLPV